MWAIPGCILIHPGWIEHGFLLQTPLFYLNRLTGLRKGIVRGGWGFVGEKRYVQERDWMVISKRAGGGEDMK